MVREGVRLVDYDNLVRAGKPIVDGIIDSGLIADDSPYHVRIRYWQRKAHSAQESHWWLFIFDKQIVLPPEPPFPDIFLW